MEFIDLVIEMWEKRNEVNPPLTILEILEFARVKLPDQEEVNERWQFVENLKAYEEAQKKWNFVNYTTKKDVKQAIIQTNREIEEWMDRKRKKIGVFYDIEIEKCLEKKEKLQKRLHYLSMPRKEGEDKKEDAKRVPIDHFIEFRGGFAKCPFHNERTGSFKYYPDDNHAYCFSCHKRADTIDVVMAINGVDFNSAIKIILNR